MNRLTKDNGFGYEVDLCDMSNAVNKLGKLEDSMEKHKIESVEKLEEILNFYDEIEKRIVEDGRVIDDLFEVEENEI